MGKTARLLLVVNTAILVEDFSHPGLITYRESSAQRNDPGVIVFALIPYPGPEVSISELERSRVVAAFRTRCGVPRMRSDAQLECLTVGALASGWITGWLPFL
jgi:hypothetical protein